MTLMNKIRKVMLPYYIPRVVTDTSTTYNDDGSWNGAFYSTVASPFQMENNAKHNNMSSLPKVLTNFLHGKDSGDVTPFYIDQAPSRPDKPPTKHFLKKQEVLDMIDWVRTLVKQRDTVISKKYKDVDPDLVRTAKLQQQVESFREQLNHSMIQLRRDLLSTHDWYGQKLDTAMDKLVAPLRAVKFNITEELFEKVADQDSAIKRLNQSTWWNAAKQRAVLAEMSRMADIAFANVDEGYTRYGGFTGKEVGDWFKNFRQGTKALEENVELDADNTFQTYADKILNMFKGELDTWQDYYLSVLQRQKEMTFQQGYQQAMVNLREKGLVKLNQTAESVGQRSERRKDGFVNITKSPPKLGWKTKEDVEK
jgi:hypothetical protein